MQVSKPRFWLLVLLLCVYLLGVLFLSAVTLHEPKIRLGFNNKITTTNHNGQIAQVNSNKNSKTSYFRRNRIQWCSELKFLKPPHEPVALASFPGSGNTWLRYLLQQSTGIYTGSVYRDYGLLKNGFPGESVTNGSVLVVKTHEWGDIARKPFTKAILLVRSPAAAIQAEFNRQSGGHVGFAAPDRYRRTKGKFWVQFVRDKLLAWKKTNLDWLQNFTGPTHVIFYEQLVENVEHTVRTVLEFLDQPVVSNAAGTTTAVQRTSLAAAASHGHQFKCAMERREGIYRRKKRVLTFDPYTAEMRAKMAADQQEVYTAIFKLATPVT